MTDRALLMSLSRLAVPDGVPYYQELVEHHHSIYFNEIQIVMYRKGLEPGWSSDLVRDLKRQRGTEESMNLAIKCISYAESLFM
jgi:hypothetical protein